MADRTNETFPQLQCLRKLLLGIFQFALRVFQIDNSLLVLRVVKEQYRNDDDETERIVNQ